MVTVLARFDIEIDLYNLLLPMHSRTIFILLGSRHVPDLMVKLWANIGQPLWAISTSNLPPWVQNPAKFMTQ